MKHVLVLASGGIDSTACIYYYLSRGFSVRTLHVDYGQRAFKPEKKALQSICDHFKIGYRCLCFHGISWSTRNSDEIVGRNLFLAAIGILAYEATHGLIAMGIHSGSEYVDCSPEFQSQLSCLARLLSRHHIDFDFPFGSWYKPEIIAYCKLYDIPVQLTYSCVDSDSDPCGLCLSCLERLDYVNVNGDIFES